MTDEKVVINADEYAAMQETLAKLENWKKDATFILDKWHKVGNALVTKQKLGEFYADLALEAAIKMRDEYAAMRKELVVMYRCIEDRALVSRPARVALKACPIAAKLSEEEGGNV